MKTSTRKHTPPTGGLAARAFELRREAVNTEARTVELAFSSETPYERWFGVEVLSHDAKAVRLDRLRNGGALLMDHNTRDQIGVVESVEIGEGRVGRALVRFGKSARADEILQDVADGIRRHVSVGYIVHEMVLSKAGKDQPDEYRVTDWEPLEVSIVSVPADHTVGVGRCGLTEDQLEHLTRAFGAAATETRTTTAPASPATPEIRTMDKTPEQLAAERQADIDAAVAARSKAVQAIASLGETYRHLGGDKVASEYLRSGKADLQEFQDLLLKKVGTPATEGSRAADVGLNRREVSEFRFLRLIQALASPNDAKAREAAAFELEACAAARQALGRSGPGMSIPPEVLRAALVPQQRDLTVGTPTAGGNLVSTDLLAGSFIELLRNRMAMTRLGARTLTGLVGDIAIPRQSGGGTAYWVAESGAPTESQQSVDQVSLSPKTVGAYTDFSRKLMLQSSIDVEAMVRGDLAMVLGLEIDRVTLYGSGASNQPQGLKFATGINTEDFGAAAPTYAEIVSMETKVAADNADVGALAYLVNATGRGALKTTSKDAGSGQFLWEQGNTVNGYRAEVSNQVESGDYWYGNWSDVIVGYWSGLDILVDPYTNSTSGTIRVVALQDVDVNFRHGESFTRGNNTL
jgi:HK97 family phage major capsid protein